MPRGQRKRGAYDCTVWFADGSRYRAFSTCVLTDAEILDAIRKHVVTPLEAINSPLSADAVGLSVDEPGSTPRAKSPSSS